MKRIAKIQSSVMPGFSDSSVADISEIFSSIQGEGLHLGERHLFVRFTNCSIHCSYCDEYTKKFRSLTIGEAVSEIQRIDSADGPHSFISMTGGEPLTEVAFLGELIAELKPLGHRILLETNGIEWRALEKVVDHVDSVAMDMKLPSVGKHRDFWDDHRRFLEIAVRKELCIKIVVSGELDRTDLDRHLELIAGIAPRTPVFIQPVWQECQKGTIGIDGLIMQARKRLEDVRLGFQLHKLLKIN